MSAGQQYIQFLFSSACFSVNRFTIHEMATFMYIKRNGFFHRNVYELNVCCSSSRRKQTVSHILEGGVGFHARHVDNTEAFNSISADF